MTKLSFYQNDPLIRESFWQKNSLVTHILFELCIFWYLAHSQILGNTLYVLQKNPFSQPTRDVEVLCETWIYFGVVFSVFGLERGSLYKYHLSDVVCSILSSFVANKVVGVSLSQHNYLHRQLTESICDAVICQGLGKNWLKKKSLWTKLPTKKFDKFLS